MRITLSALGRQIGQIALLQQHLDKLPQASQALRVLVESREAFAVRRIWWLANQFAQTHWVPKEWMLIRLAGIERVLKHADVQAALRQAMSMLEEASRLSLCQES